MKLCTECLRYKSFGKINFGYNQAKINETFL
jgi:hypothetical protein